MATKKKKVVGRPFKKGHPGGPGRPKGTPKEQEYLNTFRKCVPLDRWAKATTKLLELAEDGNIKAFEALAKYCLPQPATLLELGQRAAEAFRMAGYAEPELAEKMATEVVEAYKLKLHDKEAA